MASVFNEMLGIWEDLEDPSPTDDTTRPVANVPLEARAHQIGKRFVANETHSRSGVLAWQEHFLPLKVHFPNDEVVELANEMVRTYARAIPTLPCGRCQLDVASHANDDVCHGCLTSKLTGGSPAA